MYYTHRVLPIVILIVAILLAGCGTGGYNRSVSVSYAPPLLPIEITYDLSTGQIKLALNGRIQTPLGTFKVSYSATSIDKRFNGVRTLTVVTGTNKYVYKLEPGRPYSIRLPSDENGEAEVRYSGTDDNVEIVIPNPTSETIAELKQKLQEEQEARQRAEANNAESTTTEGQTEQIVEPVPYQTPTPPQQRVLTSQECQELVAQYTPGKFLYIPSECQDMFRAYEAYLKQQEYEARRRQQQEEYEARRRQQREDDENEQREAERRRREDDAARRRQQRIEQWGNVIEGILRRRRW